MATKRKLPEPLIKRLADDLEKQSREASKQYALLETKAQMAKLIYDNGASLESVAAKLGWPLQKLHDVFNPTIDIDLRVLSDVCTALGKRLSVSSTPIAKVMTDEVSWPLPPKRRDAVSGLVLRGKGKT